MRDLSPLGRREHEPGRRINWATFPPTLRNTFKRAGWVEHPSAATVAAVTEQWRRYATWLPARGITGLAEMDAARHEAWAMHVARLPVANGSRGRALAAVSTLWGSAPHLPGETVKGRRSAACSYLAGLTGASPAQVQNSGAARQWTVIPPMHTAVGTRTCSCHPARPAPCSPTPPCKSTTTPAPSWPATTTRPRRCATPAGQPGTPSPSPLLPDPIRQCLTGRAAALEKIAERHARTRITLGGDDARR
jgi:hypothetical protein